MKHNWSVSKRYYNIDGFEYFNQYRCMTHIPSLIFYFVKLKTDVLAQIVK